MQDKQNKKALDRNLIFVPAAALLTALLLILGACPSPTGEEPGEGNVSPIVGGVPQMPNIAKTQAGYEVDNLLAVVNNPGYSADPSHISGVISVIWNQAAGATGYNVYAKKATRFTNPISNPRQGSNGIYDTEAGDTVPAGSTALTPEPGDPVAVNIPDTFYFHRICEDEVI
jgi:hypothetical protein